MSPSHESSRDGLSRRRAGNITAAAMMTGLQSAISYSVMETSIRYLVTVCGSRSPVLELLRRKWRGKGILSSICRISV